MNSSTITNLVLLIANLILGLIYFSNYNDYLDGKYIVDGLRYFLYILFFNTLMVSLMLYLVKKQMKQEVLKIFLICLAQTSVLFVPIEIIFPIKGMIVSISIIILIIINMIFFKSKKM
jgi:hypothetical protein